MDVRKIELTRSEQASFNTILESLKSLGRGLRDSVLIAELVKFKTLHAKYVAHKKKFDITAQERWSIFTGHIGICENEGCNNYTKWKRPAYRRFCCAKCWGPNAVEGRKATCKTKYGVEYISQVPDVQKKMAQSLRAAHAANGHIAPRKGKFEYTPQPVANTGAAFYVYALLDPRKLGKFQYGKWQFEAEPFYVGKGKGGRAFDHLRTFDVERSSNPHKKNKIRAIVKAGLEPIISIKRIDLDEESAFLLEAKLIHAIGCGKLGPLTNLARVKAGGTARYTHTKKTRDALSNLSKEVWASHTEEEREARCSAISQAKCSLTLLEYKRVLKELFNGRISVSVPNGFDFRMTRRIEHVCKCGHVRTVSPKYILFHKIGCPVCIRNDSALSEQRRQLSIASKAKSSLPKYLAHLKAQYSGTIKLLDNDATTFTMRSELRHICNKKHVWSISPKLFTRYKNGCPYCMTHTNRTAKSVLASI